MLGPEPIYVDQITMRLAVSTAVARSFEHIVPHLPRALVLFYTELPTLATHTWAALHNKSI